MGVKMSDESEGQQGAQYKLKQTRSASYPSVSLKVAIEKIAILYKEATTHLVPLEFAAKKWGYAVKSSSFLKLIAALGSYGLVDFQGAGLKKQLKVNTFGERIVEKGPDWESFLRNAARQPKPFKKILEKFATKGGSLPSKEILIEKLKWDDDFKFNKEVIGRIATIFMETIDYAKLDGPAIMPPQQEEGAEKKAPVLHNEPLQVGDYVQWLSQDAYQFPVPLPIVAFSDDRTHAYFEGSQAGVPFHQLEKCSPPQEPEPPINVGGQTMSATMPNSGPRQIGAAIPVTPDCSISIMAIGCVTQEAIDTLVKYLGLIKDSFPGPTAKSQENEPAPVSEPPT